MTLGILINSIFFFGMGLCALVRPAFVVSFVGLDLPSVDARNEVRAVYGGFGVALGLLLIVAADSATLRTGVLLTVAGALLGMAFGRVVSLFIEKPGIWPMLFLLMESVLASLLLMAIDWGGISD